jgi:hypothetical protein
VPGDVVRGFFFEMEIGDDDDHETLSGIMKRPR